MPVKYISYIPETTDGQAILDNFTRTRRVLRYRENNKVIDRIKRGLPLYEVETIERVESGEWRVESKNNSGSPLATFDSLLIRGECLSACAYLKDKNIKVDLVYIDPPFASGADYARKVYLRKNPKIAEQLAQLSEPPAVAGGLNLSGSNVEEKPSATADGSDNFAQEVEIDEYKAFEEKMYGDIWHKEEYLNWMYENLTAIRSIMSETGSIYVHLDWHIGHYVKILLDEVFGEENLKSQVIWQRVTGHMDTQGFGFNHDIILIYSMSSEIIWNPQYIEYDKKYLETHYKNKDEDGRRYELDQISAAGKGDAKYFFGKLLEPPAGTHWRYSQEKIDKYIAGGKIVMTSGIRPRMKRYLDEQKGKAVQSIWTDIHPVNSQAKEDTDYSTQKPEALLERIIKASSNEGMIVADFFGGSGTTAAVAHRLGRKFITSDVGINSLLTTRDRLKDKGAAFEMLDIKDGVSLFRNPIQTMDKLKSLITGLRNEDKLDKFWEGAISSSKEGLMPVYVPNLLDHSTKVLDIPLMNRILNEAMPDLPEDVRKVIVYYIDIEDRAALDKFITEKNETNFKIELRDLKEILDEVVLNDVIDYDLRKVDGGFEIEFNSFVSDRLSQKIDEYNQKKALQGKKGKKDLFDESETQNKIKFKPLEISENGLELIEFISLDCTNAEGVWKSDVEVKIDKNSFVILNNKKTKEFWNGKIFSEKQPKRMKVRNIAGDESTIELFEM